MLVLLAVSYNVMAQDVRSVTGINGVKIDKALILADTRDGTVSFCVPNTVEGKFPYFCVTADVLGFAQALTPCGIAKTKGGPELLCGKYWQHWKDTGLMPGQTAL